MSILRSLSLIVAAASLCLIATTSSLATIYTFTDENGVVHFTNVPTDSRYRAHFGKGSGPRSYERYIFHAGTEYNVDPLLIKAVIRVESNFNRLAISRKGAMGLMQLMPETVAELDILDPFNPRENIYGGTRYLRQLLDAFNENLRLSLAAYNAGPDRVQKLGRIPRIPETERYVQKVLAIYERLQNNPSLAQF